MNKATRCLLAEVARDYAGMHIDLVLRFLEWREQSRFTDWRGLNIDDGVEWYDTFSRRWRFGVLKDLDPWGSATVHTRTDAPGSRLVSMRAPIRQLRPHP